jgi:hypothetical protein
MRPPRHKTRGYNEVPDIELTRGLHQPRFLAKGATCEIQLGPLRPETGQRPFPEGPPHGPETARPYASSQRDDDETVVVGQFDCGRLPGWKTGSARRILLLWQKRS